MEPNPTSNSTQYKSPKRQRRDQKMLNQPAQNKISYPDSSGFRIFYSCALIFYMFLQNEPIFRSSKKTVNLFLNNTNDYSPATIDYKTNPIQTHIKPNMLSAAKSRTGFGKPIYTAPATHDAPFDSGAKSHISPKSPAKTPISTSSHAKIRTQFNARCDTRRAPRFHPRNRTFRPNPRQNPLLYPFQPPKFEPIFTPPTTRDALCVFSPKRAIFPKSSHKSPFLTPPAAKIRTHLNPFCDTRQIF
jgi:hypothetical protein